jgi:signal transduction histidine kinase
MNQSARWLALAFGCGYFALGIASWVRGGVAIEAQVSGDMVVLALWAAVAILAAGIARPGLARVGAGDFGHWLALVIAAPLALLSLKNGGADAALVLALVWPFSALPLGVALGGGVGRQALARAIGPVMTLIAVSVGVIALLAPEAGAVLQAIQAAAVTAIGLGPAVMRARGAEGLRPGHDAGVLVGLAPLAGAVVLAAPSTGLVVLAVALLVVGLLNRVSIRPLARVTTQALAQRDLAIAAVEAERQRLAMDIHDGSLQSVLLLARQLEQEGHEPGAAAARAIAVELRDVAGTLRLPLLDDLGVGPALEWLAERGRRTTGAEITVTYEGAIRPPAEVELATFRIAQEALANAIRHGEPPIVVRYHTSGDHVRLSIDDAGQGFAAHAPGRDGRHGLLNMSQRAAQIGARLDFLHRPDNGTKVAVEWPAPG